MTERAKKIMCLALEAGNIADVVQMRGNENNASIRHEAKLEQELFSQDDNSNASSELNENQIKIANDMEKIMGNKFDLEDLDIQDSSNMWKDTTEPESDLEKHSDLFGSDYSDEDPTYVPPTMKNPTAEIDNEVNIELPLDFDDPEDNDHENVNLVNIENLSDTDGVNTNFDNAVETVMILLDEVLDAVWHRVRKKNRWSKSTPTEWKKNIVKKRRSTGLTYVTNKRLRREKMPQIVDCGNCKFKCSEQFSIAERSNLCRVYWSMDFKSKKIFILSNITIEPVKTRRVVKSSQKRDRSFTKKCFFKKNNERIQVCQKFFTKTLCICPDVVADAIDKVDSVGCYGSEDLRGKHEPANKVKQEVLIHVKKHIESFPVMESHYTRKDTSRQYLDPNLNIRKMYLLYIEQCKENQLIPVSEMKYRSVFGQEYNFSFFKPKKDQCLICTTYAKADSEKKEEMETQYQDHIRRNRMSQKSKQEDKDKANRDPTFNSVSFDLQAVLQIPSGQALATEVTINKTKGNNNEAVKWMKIKRIKYVKGETAKIFFNYDLSEDFKFMKTSDIVNNNNSPAPVTRLKKKKMTNAGNLKDESPIDRPIPISLEKLYKSPLPISVLKKKDLLKLCKKGIIPEELHAWINSLSTASSVIDRIPDVAIDESEEEEV
ncbi:unnamed protein product [Psylliodes chrysocephalus]|uniref:Uncharacterized protein n=1 Tax=Psylliodes chrysocephalus TaxID=3402493 RepID=A0A9P0D072_9CUCU|nr:unnamed protein product [Psylliodes chrysocephala]